jgi:hypothetical protein
MPPNSTNRIDGLLVARERSGHNRNHLFTTGTGTISGQQRRHISNPEPVLFEVLFLIGECRRIRDAEGRSYRLQF